MAGGKRAKPKEPGGRGWAIALAVVLVLALGVGGVAAREILSDGADSAATSEGGQGRTTDGDPAATEAAEAAEEQPADSEAMPEHWVDCQEELDRGRAALDAARAAVKDWSAHVQAQADLAAGRNTLAKTKAIWAPTKKRGPGEVKAFTAAEAAYEEAKGACAEVDVDSVEADLRPAMTLCTGVAVVHAEAVRAARPPVEAWDAHLKAMAARVDGALDPQHAAMRWEKAWRSAPKAIDGFRAADERIGEHAPCRLG